MNIDELSPATIGEDKFVLTLDPISDPPRVGYAVQVNVDYTGTGANGASPPILFGVQGRTAKSFVERIFRRRLPRQITFIPVASGEHVILVQELRHNRWQGRLHITVVGDSREE